MGRSAERPSDWRVGLPAPPAGPSPGGKGRGLLGSRGCAPAAPDSEVLAELLGEPVKVLGGRRSQRGLGAAPPSRALPCASLPFYCSLCNKSVIVSKVFCPPF